MTSCFGYLKNKNRNGLRAFSSVADLASGWDSKPTYYLEKSKLILPIDNNRSVIHERKEWTQNALLSLKIVLPAT
jgi:hypothetical protein